MTTTSTTSTAMDEELAEAETWMRGLGNRASLLVIREIDRLRALLSPPAREMMALVGGAVVINENACVVRIEMTRFGLDYVYLHCATRRQAAEIARVLTEARIPQPQGTKGEGK